MRLPLAFSAPAKINLGLSITGRYKNGYHRLESIFVPVSVFDRISVTAAAAEAVKHSWPTDLSPARRREIASGTLTNPLLLKTLGVMRSYLKQECALALPALQISVEKQIPSPGGLGGASADAAALIAALWAAAGSAENLPPEFIKQTERLGADIPFFLKYGLQGQAALLQGVGHELTAVSIPRLGGWICVPGFGFPTGQMFAEVRRWNLPEVEAEAAKNAASAQSNLALRLNEIPYSDEPISGVRVLRNDFDAAAQAVFPAQSRLLSEAKTVLARTAKQFFPGAWVLGMTGSGAALFAASDAEIPMRNLTSLKALLSARLGGTWQVIPFRNIGP